MKKAILLASLTLCLNLWTLNAFSFSPDFKNSMIEVQSGVLLKGKSFSKADAEKVWSKFDEEVKKIFAQTPKPTEELLNKETQKLELNFREQHKEEFEDIELGSVEAKFYVLKAGKGATWLVTYTNEMSSKPQSTFVIFREDAQKPGELQRVAAMHEFQGPWTPEQVDQSMIQIQKLKESGSKVEFGSYHTAAKSTNRSQIVWEYKSSGDKPLKATTWIPEVDWHMENGKKVMGIGLGYDVP